MRHGWMILLGLAAGCSQGTDEVLEASGTVEATEASLGFQVAGRIDSLFVVEGAVVTPGERLAVLDLRDASARLAGARATLALQAARLMELERGTRREEVAQGRAALRAVEQRLAEAERDRARVRALFEGGAVSRQALDAAETGQGVLTAERDRVVEQLRLLVAGPREEQVAAQRAAVAAARAAVEQGEAALTFAEVRAPFAGTVTHRVREPGEIVGPGTPVVTIANLDDRWIRIYVREDQVGRVALGQRAAIRVDSWPDRSFEGEVTFIASEAEFTPRNVQTQEERVRLVYRVKVQVRGDSAVGLKPGISADVTLTPPQ